MIYNKDYSTVFKMAEDDTLIITPNERLVRFLTHKYSIWKKASGVKTWIKLNSISFNGWIALMLEKSVSAELLRSTMLSPAQESLLWRRIIEENGEQLSEFNVDSYATAAQKGWSSFRNWMKEKTDLRSDADDWKSFCVWVDDYEEWKKKNKYHDAVDALVSLVRNVSPKVCIGGNRNYSKICLVGVDQLTPLQEALIERLKSFGVVIEKFELKNNAVTKVIVCTNESDEIKKAAIWAKQTLEEQPNKTIGIVSLDIGQHREKYEDIFSRVFYPQKRSPSQKNTVEPLNFSTGQPLSRTPAIEAAFDLLALLQPPYSLPSLARTFSSPFWSGGKYFTKFSGLLSSLSEHKKELSGRELTTEFRAAFKEDGIQQDLFEQLEKVFVKYKRNRSNNGDKHKSFLGWGTVFKEHLQDLGWPGDRPIDSIEFQQVQQFQSVLKDFSQLSVIKPKVNFTEALRELKLLGYRPFQAQTKRSPIQILGLLESSGIAFDYLWVLGMNSSKWPEKIKPNPLIPMSFQIKEGFPRSNVKREFHLAEKITERLRQSSINVVFSYSKSRDGQPDKLSPLIAYDDSSSEEYIPENRIGYRANSSYQEHKHDYNVSYLLNERMPGGSQALKSQSFCPFQSAMRYRFKAENYQQLNLGVSPLIRGVLIHRCLENFWQDVKSQDGLLQLDSSEITTVFDKYLKNAWRKIRVMPEIDEQVRKLEFKRNINLLKRWIEFEKSRLPFVVVELEASKIYTYKNIEIHLRVDRIDLIDDETLVVLDYKTGTNSSSSWTGSRLADPQLPLYTLVTPDANAVSYAQLHPKKIGFLGVTSNTDDIDGIKSLSKSRQKLPQSWPQVIEQWRTCIEEVVDEFVRGLAVVNPKNLSDACSYCDLSPLCRIDKRSGS